MYGDDPTVNELRRYAADLAGKEASAISTHRHQPRWPAPYCQRGEEYIVGQGAHNYLYETGGAAGPRQYSAAADRRRGGWFAAAG
ncbi:beta-eliminating lyase-related protein [Klebsiella pneumoniae]|nr:beta-eliminating lyase-related protein [Klebsiella pneumoniae]